ncbi:MULTISPECIES: single-stranded DNA-binding protein [unclassified Streptomyces]|uniref:single-stranded DNA-binding protein n=1 Tax=unclassified Streptomyces TaxID=2593676 RepID=UPI0004C0C20C|nr:MULTISPECIES: single-stranded DNA-binding protein [unclassified Streptomyces]
MNETTVCVVGNVATQPVFRESASGASARFRLAVTARYWDREKSAWADGHTNFFTVWARRALAANVGASLSVGDPVLVQGRLRVRTEQRDGQNWASADLDASAIGHDLARGTSAFRRASRPETSQGTAAQATGDQGTGTQAAEARAEPVWETEPAGDPAADPGLRAQQRPVAAGVT